MADWFVDSMAGANSANGTAYTTPKKYLWLNDGTDGLLVGATKPAAGDVVYVLDGHDEDHLTASLTMTGGAATGAAPIRIVNVASFNSGAPNALGTARGCRVYSTGGSGSDIVLLGGFYIYGFSFEAGDQVYGLTDGHLTLEKCRLRQIRGGASYRIRLVTGTFTCYIKLIDTWLSPNASCTAGINSASGRVEIIGGKMETAQPVLFNNGVINGGFTSVDGFDASLCDKIIGAISGDGTEVFNLYMKNSLLKTGTTIDEPTVGGHELLITNCKTAAGSNSEFYRSTAGSVDSETTSVRTGGAEVDGVGYSYEMLPSVRVSDSMPLKCLTITGHADFSTSKIVDIYIANTTRDLNDTEVSFDLSYPTYNQGGNTIAHSKGANWLVAPTNHADDTTSTWGGSPTYMQKMSITAGGATDGREGPFEITVFLAVDVDVFVDPDPVIS